MVFFLEQRMSPLPKVRTVADLGPSATREFCWFVPLTGLGDTRVNLTLRKKDKKKIPWFCCHLEHFSISFCILRFRISVTGALVMLKSAQFSSTSWSSPRSSAQWQRQNHEQMSNTTNRHQDSHCHCPRTRLLYAPSCASSQRCRCTLFKAKIWNKANGEWKFTSIFCCDRVLRGKRTPPSLSENQQELNSQRCCSRGDLHCQVDLRCIWVDRSPWAREEVGLQRKEERRLNLHQNVWLPTLGKGRGNGGRWKVKKQRRKLHYQIGKRWKGFWDFTQDLWLCNCL